ncbi:molybdopterin-dependent oxidoreductase [Nocardia sp. NPDC050630]|uniref:molybdopterin-dependent oxidoreductase n=1 Tax=Nocardia sp. NPDC050630 TaxID=3364321 RepID=UPI00379B29B6
MRVTPDMVPNASLPRGQRPAPHRRFGLPQFAEPYPQQQDQPVITVTGVVRHPTQIPLADLLALTDRREQCSDLHCVTTWSSLGLAWGGISFRAVHESLTALVEPHPLCKWIAFTGLDGYRSCVFLDDALADDVILADTLDGLPLTCDQGAPVRLVVPALYGYKSVRHVCTIEYLLRYEPGSAKWAEHPRGRVQREERSRYLPGLLWRPIWRAALPRVRRLYQRTADVRRTTR